MLQIGENHAAACDGKKGEALGDGDNDDSRANHRKEPQVTRRHDTVGGSSLQGLMQWCSRWDDLFRYYISSTNYAVQNALRK